MDDSDNGCMIKLNATNYSICKPRMEDYLYCRDLFEPVLGDKGKPSDMIDKKWAVMHRKIVGNIRKWIDQNIF